jgi:hypothetical protein
MRGGKNKASRETYWRRQASNNQLADEMMEKARYGVYERNV